MGSWNGTCALSQLPIHREDPVRVILLGIHPEPMRHWQTGFCGVDGVAYPLTPPMLGEYDDYGGALLSAEAKADPAVIASFKGLKLDVSAFEDEGDMQEILREAPPTSFSGIRTSVLIGIWMAHEAVFQHLMTLANGDRSWRPQPTWAEFRAMADAYAERMEQASAKMASIEDPQSSYRTVMQFWHDDFGDERKGGSRSLGTEYRISSVEFRNGTRPLVNETWRLLERGESKVDDFRPYCRAIADLMRLSHAMEATRRSFFPQGGAGSQDINFDAHQSMARFVADFVTKRKAAWDYECGEDDIEVDGSEAEFS